jgi:hypothetical protein
MTRRGSDSRTKTLTKLSTTLKSTLLNSLRDMTQLKVSVVKTTKTKISLESATNLPILLDVSTLSVLR